MSIRRSLEAEPKREEREGMEMDARAEAEEAAMSESEAMMAALAARRDPLGLPHPDHFRIGWLSAREYYRSQGVTSRSRERMLAHRQGHCHICGREMP